MTDTKEHLKIDMGFLDEKEPKTAPHTEPKTNARGTSSPPHAATPSPQVSSGYKYNWKNILIVGGIVLFICWAMFSGDSNSSSSGSSSGGSYAQSSSGGNDDSVIVGQYRCSSYYATQADSMAPSDLTKSQLDTEQASLMTRSDNLDSKKSRIDSTYVDETDQSSIDNYNYQVDSYNSQLAAYRRDAASLSSRIDSYNVQVDKYNNYLQANCTKRY